MVYTNSFGLKLKLGKESPVNMNKRGLAPDQGSSADLQSAGSARSQPAAHRHIAQTRTELRVRGMSCSNCVRHVTEAIQSVPGVAGASVSLEQAQASVRWAASAKPDIPAVLQRIASAGYEADVIETARSDADD